MTETSDTTEESGFDLPQVSGITPLPVRRSARPGIRAAVVARWAPSRCGTGWPRRSRRSVSPISASPLRLSRLLQGRSPDGGLSRGRLVPADHRGRHRRNRRIPLQARQARRSPGHGSDAELSAAAASRLQSWLANCVIGAWDEAARGIRPTREVERREAVERFGSDVGAQG